MSAASLFSSMNTMCYRSSLQTPGFQVLDSCIILSMHLIGPVNGGSSALLKHSQLMELGSRIADSPQTPPLVSSSNTCPCPARLALVSSPHLKQPSPFPKLRGPTPRYIRQAPENPGGCEILGHGRGCSHQLLSRHKLDGATPSAPQEQLCSGSPSALLQWSGRFALPSTAPPRCPRWGIKRFPQPESALWL
jgi:hypothetical protein